MKFKVLSIIFFTFFIISCENTTEVLNNSKLKNLANQLGFSVAPDMILYSVSQKSHEKHFPRLYSNYVEVFAYITDGFNFVNPTEVKANSELLLNMEADIDGQFSNIIEPFPINNIVNWDILGWAGVNYNGIQELSNPIDFISPRYLDTVLAINGFTINYSGAANIGSILVDLQPAASENFVYLGMTSMPSNSSISFYAPDNGSIFVPASLLANIPKNIFYTVQINNYKSSEEKYNGRVIVKKSIFATDINIFLTN